MRRNTISLLRVSVTMSPALGPHRRWMLFLWDLPHSGIGAQRSKLSRGFLQEFTRVIRAEPIRFWTMVVMSTSSLTTYRMTPEWYESATKRPWFPSAALLWEQKYRTQLLSASHCRMWARSDNLCWNRYLGALSSSFLLELPSINFLTGWRAAPRKLLLSTRRFLQ
jgi:hypothetical protein